MVNGSSVLMLLQLLYYPFQCHYYWCWVCSGEGLRTGRQCSKCLRGVSICFHFLYIKSVCLSSAHVLHYECLVHSRGSAGHCCGCVLGSFYMPGVLYTI